MVKIKPKKRGPPMAEMPWPDPVAKRAKMNTKKEEDEDKKLDLASVLKHDQEEMKKERDYDATLGNTGPIGRQAMPKESPETLILKELEAFYPPEMIRELTSPKLRGKGQPQSTSSASSSSNDRSATAVYVVTHVATAPMCRIVGTYSSVEAANLRVMYIFRESHPELTEDQHWEGRIQGQPEWGARWWIDKDGLLSLWSDYEWDVCRVCATKQVVGTDGLAGNLVSVYSKIGCERE
ncbi:hypothetical protein F4677DRAFT_465898 [Hypoxylon crocopeplum]|nr:hypothetical protein F4677DRAFT_465898 [Hypoxylon crocopeplum]